MYMDKRDDYKQTIMNMETVLAKLLTLDHSMSEQQLDMQIPQLLEQIGEYTQSDRVYFFDWASPDCRIYRNTYEWCKEGVYSLQERMQKIYVQMIPCWQKRFEQGDRVWIANIDDVQNEMPFEYELLQMRGVHTAIVVPVMSQNHLNGFMGHDRHYNRCIIPERSSDSWQQSCYRTRERISVIFANIIEPRKKSTDR